MSMPAPVWSSSEALPKLDTAPFDAQLAVLSRSRLRLRFGAALEEIYRRYRLEQSLPLMRLSMALGVLFYGSFLLGDLLVWHRYAESWVLGMIWGVAAPSALGLFAATYSAPLRPYILRLARLVVLANGLALVGAIVLGTATGAGFPPEVLIIHFSYLFFLVGLSFEEALPIGVLEAALFVAGNSWAGMEMSRLVEHGYFLGATLVVCSLTCFLKERAERREWLQSQRAMELAQHDGLTGLLNYRTFVERASSRLRQGRREGKGLALLLLDIDRFKRVNDGHGHPAGDECLRRLGGVLTRGSRRPMDLAARLGGEEFVVLLYDTSREWGLARAEQFRAEIEALAVALPDGTVLRFTVSIGLAFATAERATSVEQWIAAADAAMYRAKNEGRNQVSEAAA